MKVYVSIIQYMKVYVSIIQYMKVYVSIIQYMKVYVSICSTDCTLLNKQPHVDCVCLRESLC